MALYRAQIVHYLDSARLSFLDGRALTLGQVSCSYQSISSSEAFKNLFSDLVKLSKDPDVSLPVYIQFLTLPETASTLQSFEPLMNHKSALRFVFERAEIEASLANMACHEKEAVDLPALGQVDAVIDEIVSRIRSLQFELFKCSLTECKLAYSGNRAALFEVYSAVSKCLGELEDKFGVTDFMVDVVRFMLNPANVDRFKAWVLQQRLRIKDCTKHRALFHVLIHNEQRHPDVLLALQELVAPFFQQIGLSFEFYMQKIMSENCLACSGNNTTKIIDGIETNFMKMDSTTLAFLSSVRSLPKLPMDLSPAVQELYEEHQLEVGKLAAEWARIKREAELETRCFWKAGLDESQRNAKMNMALHERAIVALGSKYQKRIETIMADTAAKSGINDAIGSKPFAFGGPQKDPSVADILTSLRQAELHLMKRRALDQIIQDQLHLFAASASSTFVVTQVVIGSLINGIRVFQCIPVSENLVIDFKTELDWVYFSYLDGLPLILPEEYAFSHVLEDEARRLRFLGFFSERREDFRPYLQFLTKAESAFKLGVLAKLAARKRSIFSFFHTVMIFENAVKRMSLIKRFLKVSHSVSIDCRCFVGEYEAFILQRKKLAPHMPRIRDHEFDLSNLAVMVDEMGRMGPVDSIVDCMELAIIDCEKFLKSLKLSVEHENKQRLIVPFQVDLLNAITSSQVFDAFKKQAQGSINSQGI